jgi:hypothetical protein
VSTSLSSVVGVYVYVYVSVVDGSIDCRRGDNQYDRPDRGDGVPSFGAFSAGRTCREERMSSGERAVRVLCVRVLVRYALACS